MKKLIKWGVIICGIILLYKWLKKPKKRNEQYWFNRFYNYPGIRKQEENKRIELATGHLMRLKREFPHLIEA